MSHIENDAHKYARTTNRMDEALVYYAQQKNLNASSDEARTSNSEDFMSIDSLEDDIIHNFADIYFQGWARRVRKARRLTEKQKTFIEGLFRHGALRRMKLSAEQRMQDSTGRVPQAESNSKPCIAIE